MYALTSAYLSTAWTLFISDIFNVQKKGCVLDVYQRKSMRRTMILTLLLRDFHNLKAEKNLYPRKCGENK